MKCIITILFVIICQDIFCQDYVGHWNRTGAKIDSVQQSIDGVNFKTIQTIFGGIDSSIVPGATYYYRVRTSNNVSNIVLVYSLLPISITNFFLQTNTSNVVMGWTSQNEDAGGYYRISRSYDGVNFTPVSIIAGMGNS